MARIWSGVLYIIDGFMPVVFIRVVIQSIIWLITLANRHGRIELETVERKALLRRILSAE